MKAGTLVSVLVVLMATGLTTKHVTCRSTEVEYRLEEATLVDESELSLDKVIAWVTA